VVLKSNRCVENIAESALRLAESTTVAFAATQRLPLATLAPED